METINSRGIDVDPDRIAEFAAVVEQEHLEQWQPRHPAGQGGVVRLSLPTRSARRLGTSRSKGAGVKE